MQKVKSKRLQFDFTDKEIKRLDKIKRHIEARTRAETVRRIIKKFYEEIT